MSALVLRPSVDDKDILLTKEDYSDSIFHETPWQRFKHSKRRVIILGSLVVFGSLLTTALVLALQVKEYGCGPESENGFDGIPSDSWVHFNLSEPGVVCTLNTEEGTIARSYDGFQWEAFGSNSPVSVDCYSNNRCKVRTPKRVQRLYLKSFTAKNRLDSLEVNAKFLTQTTFGPTLESIASLAQDFESWFRAQAELPATLHRSYFRERVNVRTSTPSTVGKPRKACEQYSRWHRHALVQEDVGKTMLVESEGGLTTFTVDSVIRHQSTDVAKDFGGNLVGTSYHVCEVLEHPNRPTKVKLDTGATCNNKVEFQNPSIELVADPSTERLIVVNEGAVDELDPPVLNVKVLNRAVDGCENLQRHPLFLKAGSTYYMHDSRLALKENTLKSPLEDSSQGTACHNVPISPFNAGSCTVSARTCQVAQYAGTPVTLNEEFLRDFYLIANKFVYSVNNLPLDKSPCETETSRWEITNGPCAGQVSADAALVGPITASQDPNPIVRVVQRTAACDSPEPPGVQVEVGGVCYTHVHPHTHNVYDFTAWSQLNAHPGNREKLEMGELNPITRFALEGGTALAFPNSHSLSRWTQNARRFPLLGRLGDQVAYASIPSAVQDLAHATKYGAVLQDQPEGVLGVVCGSPGEVASDPTKGSRFGIAVTSSLDVQDAKPFDQRTFRRFPKQITWFNIALRAPDQLRQRTAWALSQVLVVSEQSVGLEERNESYLAYYDIFVRHALGNYLDVLMEVSYSPMMGRMLSYIGSRSYSNTVARNSPSFPDENYAREIMQLFTIGLWELNEDGTRKLDAEGEPISTYLQEDIFAFAKAWTGFDTSVPRGNIENVGLPTGANFIDPMVLHGDRRDPFPKLGLRGRYIGDQYPLCTDFPGREFLQKGAKFRFLGSTSTPQMQRLMTETNRPLERVVLATESKLREALCDTRQGGECSYSAELELVETLECTGQECDLDTVRVVKISLEEERCPTGFVLESSVASGDLCRRRPDGETKCPSGCRQSPDEEPLRCLNAGNAELCRVQEARGLYFEYVRPPCVDFAFFNDGLKVSTFNTQLAHCANPLAKVASEACCYNDRNRAKGLCNYDGEVGTFSSAQDRCESRFPGEGLGVCDFSFVDTRCSARWELLYWTSATCDTKIKVRADGAVAQVHDVIGNKERMLEMVSEDNENWFRVLWKENSFPAPENDCLDGLCELVPKSGPVSEYCSCRTAVNETAAFTELPSQAEVLEQLFVGAHNPNSAKTEYELRDDLGSGDVKVYVKVGGAAFDQDTVFEVTENTVLKYLKNMVSVVHIPGTSKQVPSFRNPPKFLSFSELTTRDAQYETRAVVEHLFYHPNTAPFISRALIQRLVTSNPSPRYVASVSQAFRTGSVKWIGSGSTDELGSSRYGDLKATLAAIIFDREARSEIVDWDPSTGKLREPLLKVVHLMRSMSLEVKDGSEVFPQYLEDHLGMAAHRAPSVFSFFQPDLIVDGPSADNSLVVPEATLLQGPKVLGMLNSLQSFIAFGLDNCYNGLGTPPVVSSQSCGSVYNQRIAVGSKNARQSARLSFGDNFGPDTSPEDVLDALNLLLLSGRMSNRTRAVLADEYLLANATGGTQYGVRVVQNLLLVTPEFNALGNVPGTGLVRQHEGPREVQAAGLRRFKAVVYVNFAGGADSFNLLVPRTCPSDKDLFAVYAKRRGNVAFLKSEILPIDDKDGGQPCSQFGIHPALTTVQELYQNDDAVFFANLGPLVEPVEQHPFPAGVKLPAALFAHNTQTKISQTVTKGSSEVGVLGRIRDELYERGYSAASFSIAGRNYILNGSPGGSPSPDTVDQNSGVSQFQDRRLSTRVGAAVGELLNATTSNVFGETWASTVENTISRSKVLSRVLDDENISGITTTFPSTSMGKQFKQVAKLIKSRTELEVDRTSFYTQIGGFDTHGNAKSTLQDRMTEVNDAVAALVTELKEQEVWNDVVLIFGSEFGRTFTSNGVGTDHAWGGNYFALGGGLKGGRILGSYPEDLESGSTLDMGRGRFVPTTSWDSPWNAVAEWLGIEDQTALDRVSPNRNNFPELWSKDELFTSD